MQDTVETNKVDQSGSVTTSESDAGDMEALPRDDAELVDRTDTREPDALISEGEQVSEDVPVSPYGFGPYPEVPADFPFDASWTDLPPEVELLTRVMIKAWNDGDRFVVELLSKGKSCSITLTRSMSDIGRDSCRMDLRYLSGVSLVHRMLVSHPQVTIFHLVSV